MKNDNEKRIRKIIIVCMAIMIISICYLLVHLSINSVLGNINVEEKIDESELEININDNVEEKIDSLHRVLNIMIVGADNLEHEERYSSYAEERSDVLKILSLDYTDKEIKLTSVDRDVVVYLPGRKKEYGHFNWAYSYGGSKLAIQTINYNLDLDVKNYVTFSFAGFIKVIDILGGIDIELTQKEADAFNDLIRSNAVMNIHAVEGINHLDGHDALSYARQRFVDSDFKRMDRQNIVINAVLSKLKESSVTDLLKIVNDCLPYINTNITISEIKDLLTDLVEFNLSDIKTYTYPKKQSKDVCKNPDLLGGYLIRGYSQQVIDLHNFIYEIENYKPSNVVLNLEKDIYSTFGEFYENSPLLH